VCKRSDVLRLSSVPGSAEATALQSPPKLDERLGVAQRAAGDLLESFQVVAHGVGVDKTMGDGFLAGFDGPARAIRCARAIQERANMLGLPVRAGLHTASAS
jgi:class 3 adenylate cyclase